MSNRQSLSTVNMPTDKPSLHVLTEADLIPDNALRLGTCTIGHETENQWPISTTAPGPKFGNSQLTHSHACADHLDCTANIFRSSVVAKVRLGLTAETFNNRAPIKHLNCPGGTYTTAAQVCQTQQALYE